MKRADAVRRLTGLLGGSPALAAATLDALVSDYGKPDAAGLPASNAAWDGFIDLNAAAAEGWQLKAALTASNFDLKSGEDEFKLAQHYQHCMVMAEFYGRLRLPGSVRTVRSDVVG